MADFNPDAFLAEASPVSPAQTALTAQQFDPDAFLHEQNIAQHNTQQAEFGTLPQQALAGVEGAIQGALPYAGTKAELATGLTTPENIQARRAANPVTSTVGNILGTGAILGATGGAGALTKGAGLAGKALGYAAEGTALAAADLSNDLALGDPNLNAQKVISHLGMGAVLGAGFGAASHGIEVGMPLVKTKLTQVLDKFVKPDGPFAMGLRGEDLQSGSRGLVENLGAVRTAKKEAVEEIYNKVLPAQMKVALEDVDVNAAKAAAEQTLGTAEKNLVRSTVDGSALEPLLSKENNRIVQEQLAHVTDQVENASSAYDVQKALHDFAKKFDKNQLIKFDKLPTASQMAEQEGLQSMRTAVRDSLRDPAVWGPGAKTYAEITDLYSASKAADKNFVKSFMKKTGDGKMVVDPGKAKSFFNNMQDVSNDLRRAQLDEFMQSAKAVAAKSEEVEGLKTGVQSVSKHVEQLAKEQSRMAELSQVIKDAQKQGALTKTANHVLGVGHLLHELAPYNLGKNLGHVIEHVQGLQAIIKKTNDAIGKEARSIFTASSRAGAYSLSHNTGYDKRSKLIREYTANPQQSIDNMTNHTAALYNSAPNVTSALHNTSSTAMAFLAAKLPKPSREFPMGGTWEPSKTQKAEFNNYWNIIEDPVAALKQVKQGTLTKHTMEALAAVHPQLLEDMQHAVLSSINPKKKLPYSVQMSLSMFLGMPMNQQMLPMSIMSNQAALNTPVEQSPNLAGKKPTQGGLKELDAASRNETETQQLEAEND